MENEKNIQATSARIKESVDVRKVATLLGLQTKPIGGRVSIVCPTCNAHFGTCFLTDTGYHCAACNQQGTITKMVMNRKSVSKEEAYQFLEDNLDAIVYDCTNPSVVVAEIIKQCNESNITSFCSLVDYAMEYRPDWFAFLCNNKDAVAIVTAYVESTNQA